jgi:hypothetical protein
MPLQDHQMVWNERTFPTLNSCNFSGIYLITTYSEGTLTAFCHRWIAQVSFAHVKFVKNRHLIDFWANTFNRAIFTNYTTNSASRIGRLCFPPTLFQNKMGTEILATVFTNHLAAAALLIITNIPILHVSRNCWKLNTRLLCHVDIIQRLKEQ